MVGIWASIAQVRIAKELSVSSSFVLILDGTTLKHAMQMEVYVVILRYFVSSLCAVKETALGLVGFEASDDTDGNTIFLKSRAMLADFGVAAQQITATCSDSGSNLAGHITGVYGDVLRECIRVFGFTECITAFIFGVVAVVLLFTVLLFWLDDIFSFQFNIHGGKCRAPGPISTIGAGG
ncbi:hypothetical protein DIPPA_10660 [Diplonema papillatum]|nr:hypothetical protein DIPPA_24004 [Diplonema papillatum]KAJ9440765.1 hypothetical protein DIPPA_31657 [Diplonema papillatum]KAJ9462734.1 hypothetical protein DIPPA_10685 [Diplonema papillatum]KAJ9462736.1 hypothetical protein DIPPA_10668 [Diplonema papillatum]KAJ9462738.1 hypothetical protein DIPPA_10660 [Diplonema papillatum]